MSQETYKTPQYGRMFRSQQSSSNHTDAYPSFVMGPNSSVFLPQDRTIHRPTSFTVRPNPLGMSNLSGPLTVPEVHQSSRIEKNRRLSAHRASRQGPTIDTAPPSRFYINLATKRVQPPTPNEPIEEDVITRQISRTTLPPYSPGEFLRDEDVPPVPGR